MAYVSLYRKYRPQIFEEVIGQEHVTRTLQNAIKMGRISHAYLFCGPRGTGKTTTARILAKALNCEKGPTAEPCNECHICREIKSGASLDVIEFDAASIRKLDPVRELINTTKFVPVSGRYKVYIMDEAHELIPQAWDALLKTLEEPPRYVIFVLVTTEPYKLPPTILSRCQRFEFRRVAVGKIIDYLRQVLASENVGAEEASLSLIARSVDGSVRDALSILEQTIAYTDKTIRVEDLNYILGLTESELLFQLAEVIANNDSQKAFEIANQIIFEGKDVPKVLNDLMEHFRNLLLIKTCQDVRGLVEVSEATLGQLKEQARRFEKNRIIEIINTLAQAERETRWNSQHRLVLELALMRLITPRIKIHEEMPKEAEVVKSSPEVRPETSELEALPEEVTVGELKEESREIKELEIVKKIVEEEITTERQQINLEEINRRWLQILEQVKKEKSPLYFMLVHGKPNKFENNKLTIQFDYPFHKEQLEEPQNKEIVERVIGWLFSQEVEVQSELVPKEPESALSGSLSNQSERAEEPKPSQEALVQRLLAEFGGKIVKE